MDALNSNSSTERTRVGTPSQSFLFPKYPQLPKEIRDLIWDSTLPDARIIEVYAKGPYNNTGLVSGPLIHLNTPTSSRCQYPHSKSLKWQEHGQKHQRGKYTNPALSVCRESREFALKHYAWCFTYRSAQKKLDKPPWQSGIVPCCKLWVPRVLFQPKKDIIRLRAESLVPGADIERAIISAFAEGLDCSRIRAIAIDEKLFQDVPLFIALFQGNERDRPPLFEGLKELFVIRRKAGKGIVDARFEDRISFWKKFFEKNTTITPLPTFSCVGEDMLPIRTRENLATYEFNQIIKNLVLNGDGDVD